MENAKIQQLLTESYDFKFGDYISEGFEILKKNIGGFVIFAIVFLAVSMISGLIPFIGSLANSLILTPCLMAGLYLVANQVQKNQQTEFGDFFKGFQYVSQLALVTLLAGIIVILSLLPFIVANAGLGSWLMEFMMEADTFEENPELIFENLPPFSSWTLILLLPAIYLGTAYSWAPLFVVFHKLGFWEALEASRIMITKKWFIYFFFTIVVGIIAIIGMLGFCIGFLFTFPAAYCMIYAAFADVTKLNEINEDDVDLMDHLVE